MRCWNCRRKIPDKAKVCHYCEASMADRIPLGAEEERTVLDFMEQMPPEVLEALLATADKASTAEEFADLIMVGPCPKCGSTKTGNCEHDPDIDCILVGRCYDCGQLFCTECQKLLPRDKPECACWDEPLPFDDDEEDGPDEE